MDKPFSKILEEYQLKNGYTNVEMAMILGLSERMYLYYLKGDYDGSTKKIRVIPMPDELVVYLKQMRLDEYPSSYYVFGSPATVGRGWTGIKSKQFYFMPSAVRVKRDTLTKYWKVLIKDELGLDVDMYGLKYKSGEDRLLAGIRLETIQDIYGHSERQMTKGYLSKLQGVQMQEIKDKAPKF